MNNYLFKRDDLSNGNWNNIQTLSASSTAYTDPNYSTFQSTGSWRVETQWSISCNPSYRTGRDLNAMAIVNTSRSNIKNQMAPLSAQTSAATDLSFSIYPNPAKDEIFISLQNTNTVAKVEIFDVTGRVVFSTANYTSNLPVNISTLSNGIYTLKVMKEGKQMAKKIIIER